MVANRLVRSDSGAPIRGRAHAKQHRREDLSHCGQPAESPALEDFAFDEMNVQPAWTTLRAMSPTQLMEGIDAGGWSEGEWL